MHSISRTALTLAILPQSLGTSPLLRSRSLLRTMSQLHINKPVPGAHQYFPLNEPAIGTAYPEVRACSTCNPGVDSDVLTLCSWSTVGVSAECGTPNLVQADHYPRCHFQEQDFCSMYHVFTDVWLLHHGSTSRIYCQSPMCQYSSDNGHATDWHFVHIGVNLSLSWSRIAF